MKLAITSEYHFLRGPDGVYTDAVYPYEYWNRFREVFEEVLIFARVRQTTLPRGARRVTGPHVEVAAVPEFVGSRGVLKAGPALAMTAWRVSASADAFVLRAPGVMATALREALRVRRKPYGVAVLGDPRESLLAGDRAMRALRWLSAAQLREQVHHAAASRFVTREHLQRHYPPRPGTFTVSVSDVALPDALFAEMPVEVRPGPALSIGFVGMLERSYKGLDVALAALRSSRYPHTLHVAGDGVLRRSYEGEADRFGVADRVSFAGQVSRERIFDFLRDRDVFILPSRTEGMPRALLEAMAVGLPCLATPVGGVPELIAACSLVPVDAPVALAAALDHLGEQPAERRRRGAENRIRASEYRKSEMVRRRSAFYEAVRATAQPR